MFVANRWVCLAFIINWFAQSATDLATVNGFFSAINY